MQHEEEHIDEVEVESQSPHNSALCDHRRVVANHQIAVLDPLRIIGGEAGEDQNADDG